MPDSSTSSENLIQGTAGTAIVKAGGIGLSFLASLMLARLLGASGYGVYAYAVSWALLLSVPAGLGLDTLLTREVARYQTRGDQAASGGVLWWSVRVALTSSGVLGLLAASCIWFFQQRIEPATVVALWTALLILPIWVLLRLQQGTILGLGRVVSALAPQLVLHPALLLALAGVFFLSGRLNAPLTVGVYAIAATLALLLGSWPLRSQLRVPKNFTIQADQIQIWWRGTWPLFVAATAGMLNDLIAVILLGILANTESAGVFDVARKMAILVSFGLVAVSIPLAPAVANLHTSGNHVQLQRVVVQGTRASLLIALPVAIGLIVFGHWGLSLFGSAFQSGFVALIILCLGQLVNAYTGSVAVVLNMTGHERDVSHGVLAAAILNTLLSILLIPRWGLEGAAVANLVGIIVFNVLLGRRVYQRLGIRVARLGPLKMGLRK